MTGLPFATCDTCGSLDLGVVTNSFAKMLTAKPCPTYLLVTIGSLLRCLRALPLIILLLASAPVAGQQLDLNAI